ncbi:hypothetical protein ACFL9U_00945 [Thermodesulfobacteriota bacterium]
MVEENPPWPPFAKGGNIDEMTSRWVIRVQGGTELSVGVAAHFLDYRPVHIKHGDR